MACVRLDRVPRNGYCCPKCYIEEDEFSNLKFTVGDHFEVGLQTPLSSCTFKRPSFSALSFSEYRNRKASTYLRSLYFPSDS
jgi:hypothetical protein